MAKTLWSFGRSECSRGNKTSVLDAVQILSIRLVGWLVVLGLAAL